MNTENNINVIDMSGEEPRQFTFQMPKLPAWDMAQQIGYEPKTTFWQDFSIADIYGPEAIMDTFRRAFSEWRDDVEYIAEMSLVLNHKGLWYHTASEQHGGDEALSVISELYFTLWENLHDWARKHFTGEEGEYYFNVTD